MLPNIPLQDPGPCFPIVGGVADAAGEEYGFIGVVGSMRFVSGFEYLRVNLLARFGCVGGW